MIRKNNDKTNIEDIKTRSQRYDYKIGGSNLTVELEDALFGKINGYEEMLDKPMVDNFVDTVVSAVKKYTTKYNPVPKTITISRSEHKKKEQEPHESKSLLHLQKPVWGMDDVCIDSVSKEQIMAALTIIRNKDKIYGEWGLHKVFKNNRSVVLNFYGPSGTGKSIMAEAIAGYLERDMLAVNYSELESKYVGETPKNISEIFKHAEATGAVIVFDEADSFLGKRLTNVSQSADYGVNVTRSVMLMEIEKYSGVVIFTTNLIKNYDEAFKRRILANVEFKLPDEDARKQIWKTHIPAELPVASDVTPETLAGLYKDISGADIKDMVLYASVACIRDSRSRLGLADFGNAYEYISKRNTYDTDAAGSFEVTTTEITQEEYERQTGGTK